MEKKKILYIGRFELPDKEATANRVVANAKLLRDIGYEVVLAGWSDEVSTSDGWIERQYYGFRCYEKHKAKTSYEKYKMFSDSAPEESLLKRERFDILIAYDFPAVALKKLVELCRKNKICYIADVSEWYTNSNKNPIFRVVRAYDSYLRMKVLHKKTDGLIAISRYLQDYYASECDTILVPPLVDIEDEKWNIQKKEHMESGLHLVYAGWPSRTKERLDLLVKAVSELSESFPIYLDIYGVSEKNYADIYGAGGEEIDKHVRFHGRVSHVETIKAVKSADYSVIIRESNRKNNAGFPSKLVESVSCGTAVLTTPISNVSDFVGEGKNGYIISIDSICEDLKYAFENRESVCVNKEAFDYRTYKDNMKKFIEKAQEKVMTV